LLALASDEWLAAEIARGSESAFEVIYERHGDGLLSLCRHMLGSPEEAEEALQLTFAAAWSDLQRSDRPAPERLRPWLFGIARNRCLSLLRVRRPESVDLDEVPSTAGFADEVADRADLSALLGDLRELPEEQRTALLLSELGGLSHADIAAVLEREEASIKGLVFRARSTLIDWREARDTPCEEFREQIAVLRRGALRRKALRRHLQSCAACRHFRKQVKAQRGMIALVLPIVPSTGLKGSAVAAGMAGAAAGGGGATGGAAAGLGLGALASAGSTAAATAAAVSVVIGGGLITAEVREGERDEPPAGTPSESPEPVGRRAAGWQPDAVTSAAPISVTHDGATRTIGDPLLAPRFVPSGGGPGPVAPDGPAPPPLAPPAVLAGPAPVGPGPGPSGPPPSGDSRHAGTPASDGGGSGRSHEAEASQGGTRSDDGGSKASSGSGGTGPEPAGAPTRQAKADQKAAERSAEAESELAAKIAEAESDLAAKIAKAENELAAAISKAESEAAAKIAKAESEAEGKGSKEQRKAAEKIAQARAEADEKIAEARAEAADDIAKARAEAADRIAKAQAEASRKS
jgi:RNA polymerase sigma factor (sigma-70 family)